MKSYPRKRYFRERTISEKRRLELDDSIIQNALNNIQFGSLVLKIDKLQQNEGLIIPPLLPDEFYISTKTPQAAGRKAFHHIGYIRLPRPKTLNETEKSGDTPLKMRQKAFSSLTKEIGETPEIGRENNMFNLGYSYYPVQSGDTRRRVVPFVWLAEGARTFSYAYQLTHGIDIKIYEKAQRVEIEGATVRARVPSKRQKHPRYEFDLENVPIKRNQRNLATALRMKPAVAISEEGTPLKGQMPHELYNIRYNYLGDREHSNLLTFYPHHIAGYLGIIFHEWSQESRNLTPLEMNPFAIPSKHQMEFYKRLNNNVLVFDKNSNAKNHLRSPYIAEKSVLLGRAIAVFGEYDFAFWDGVKDGRLRDYNSWKWGE
jgi:hypothetical protein